MTTMDPRLLSAITRLTDMADSYADGAAPNSWDSGLVFGLRQSVETIQKAMEEA